MRFVRHARGQRVAVYQLTRPEAANHFVGRIDFAIGGSPQEAKLTTSRHPPEDGPPPDRTLADEKAWQEGGSVPRARIELADTWF